MSQETKKEFDFDFYSLLCPGKIDQAFELISSKNFQKEGKKFKFPVTGFIILEPKGDETEYHAKLNIKEDSKK